MRINETNEFSPWDELLSAQLEAAMEAARRASTIPAYKREWGAAGVDAFALDASLWQQLPPISKEKLVDACSDHPPFGDRLGVVGSEIAHIFVAPGPLFMPFTRGDLDHVARSFAKALKACGFEPSDVVDQTTMYNWVIAATVMDRALAEVGCCVIPGGVGQSERHLEIIAQAGVNAIVAFPTFLEHLLNQAPKGFQLPLRKAAVMGELRDPDAKQRIQEAHGIKVREFYGVADVGAVAWECEAGNGMHLRDDLYVEFLAPGGTESVVPSANQPAEMVVTDFHRRAMPIIRLRTGDIVEDFSTNQCRCGRSSPRFSRIVGRASEITKVKGMFVVPRTAADVLLRAGIDRTFRLLVDRDPHGRDILSMEIEGTAPPDKDLLQAKIEAALRIRIQLEFVTQLPTGGPRLLDRRFLKET